MKKQGNAGKKAVHVTAVDLTKLIQDYRKKNPEIHEDAKSYLVTFEALGRLAGLTLDPSKAKKVTLEIEKTFSDAVKSYIPYFAKRFPSISIEPYTKAEILDFAPESLLVGAIKEFGAFAKGDPKLTLSELLSSFRYLLTFELAIEAVR
jgi:hypothetical protein